MVAPKNTEAWRHDAALLAGLVDEAYTELQPRVLRTSTVPLHWLSRTTEPDQNAPLQVYAKLECDQHTGSFKYRGALNAMRVAKAETVVTASAGNHALAVCAAAKTMGKRSSVIMPTACSELKARRIIAEADEVSFHGKDLYEASMMAQEQIQRQHDRSRSYISPYAAVEVAAGAGTLMREATEDSGPFDAVIVPLGGGGLISGVTAWCSVHSPHTKIIAAHPGAFGRESFMKLPDMKISDMLAQPIAQTICDGLAVQLTEQTPLASVMDNLISEVVHVAEDDVSMAIAEGLRYQSILLEGSAAASIAAYRQIEARMSGKVLLLLTGRNTAPAVIGRALTEKVTDKSSRQKMGLRNVLNPCEKHGALGTLRRSECTRTNICVSSTDKPIEIIERLTDGLLDNIMKQTRLHDHYQSYCTHLKLAVDPWTSELKDDLLSRNYALIHELKTDLKNSEMSYVVAEERYRVLLQACSSSQCLLERGSPSHDQAVMPWFADPATQNPALVNYDRYGALQLRDAELMLLDTIRPATSQNVEISLLLTTSGMAAYQIYQQFLLQRLQREDLVLLPPYIYFEASEQLEAFSRNGLFRLSHTSSYDAMDILSTAESQNARVVFLDPVANVAGLPTTDVRHFAAVVSNRRGWESRIVVIDGTMISGGLPVFDWFRGPHAPLILYSESASKYTQMGLDLQMAGLTIFPAHLDGAMRKIRRDIGAVMYTRGISLLPALDFDTYQLRLSFMTANAAKLGKLLKTSLDPEAVAIAFPTCWQELGWRHGGAVLTIDFLERGLNNREGLEACIELILRRARAARLPLSKGVSFGFSTSRVSASSSMAEGSDPFLRVSVGIDPGVVELLADVITGSVSQYLGSFSCISGKRC